QKVQSRSHGRPNGRRTAGRAARSVTDERLASGTVTRALPRLVLTHEVRGGSTFRPTWTDGGSHASEPGRSCRRKADSISWSGRADAGLHLTLERPAWCRAGACRDRRRADALDGGRPGIDTAGSLERGLGIEGRRIGCAVTLGGG